ncbi:hypothetical protein MJT46_014538 [Ovis ammon polii x Ovis aries]|nr:hypothetical protein MJT46_014538 [Ovis ammon polii x Ovis aries]
MAGGAGWAGAPAALLRSVRRLREVFEVCGRDPDGFLRVERVAALGLRFGQGEEGQASRRGSQLPFRKMLSSGRSLGDPTGHLLCTEVQSALHPRSCLAVGDGRLDQGTFSLKVEKLVKYLDPNDLGRINFKDFCRGVFAMKGCEELLKDVLSVESAGTLPCAPEIPDCVEQGSEVPDPTFADGELLPTEPDFFPEDEDEAMTLAPPEGPQESDMEGPMESTRILEGPVGIPAEKDAVLGGLFLPEDKSLGHPPSMTTSDLSTHSTTSLISNEEQFEDYGEADDVDCAPGSPCPDDETRTNVYSDLGSSVSSRWPLSLQRPLGSRKSGRTNPASSRGVSAGRAMN